MQKKRNDMFNSPEMEEMINWKSIELLKRHTTRFGDIKPRKYTHIPVKFQKRVRSAIMRARELGLLPFTK